MAMGSAARDRCWGGDLSAAVALFRRLGDATRLSVVQELASGERRIVDLTARLGLAQSTVSAHVAWLCPGNRLRSTLG
jgi:DNA-binding transcriptional ArsR family regulator